MIWNQPKKIWQWLALVGPGAASLACTAFGKLALPKDNEVAASLLGLPLTFFLCLAVGYMLARKTGNPGKVFGLTALFSFILMVVNFSIAIGGCVAMSPHFDIR